MISENDIVKLILGFKLRHLRLQQKVSYQELSKETGLSISYLNDIEKGKKYPKPDKIRSLATAFGVSYDELVSTKADKKLQPVIELLNSGFFRYFPAAEFGFSIEKLIDFFTTSPDKISAFISTILKMVRSYQIEKEHFYRVALRSYQDMHDNYFPALEESVSDFKDQFKIKKEGALSIDYLKEILSHYQIATDQEELNKHKKLQSFRSYFNEVGKRLYLNGNLSEGQVRFMLAKELGYQYLDLKERAFETHLSKEASFDKLLNNFKASYFAAALLIDAEEIVKDLQQLTIETSWQPELIAQLLDKYKVTPETLLQRFTNILPHYFKIDNLFFIRLQETNDLINYKVSKELHLSGLHNPYQNQLSEHLCHRWVSISAIKSIRSKKDDYLVDAQVSEYWQTDNAYFCITVAQPGRFNTKKGSSVTLGLAMNDALRGAFNFIKDPTLKRRTVHTTCERCSIPDCDNRVAAPVVIDRINQEAALAEELKKL